MTDTDPFAQQEQQFKDAIAKLHTEVPGAVKRLETKVETVALNTVEEVKAEFVLLETRFKAAAARLEDLTVKGIGNPVFAQANKLMAHLVGIAKSL